MDANISEGEVWAWVDGGSVQLKAVASSGDPADLTGDEARRIARRLLELADEADNS